MKGEEPGFDLPAFLAQIIFEDNQMVDDKKLFIIGRAELQMQAE